MVNLVRFRERSLDDRRSGWAAYARYSRAGMPLLKEDGGTVLWAGHVEGAALRHLCAGGRWDWVVLAQYPSRAAFLSVMTSPEDAVANVDRENGVDDHVILLANQAYSKFMPELPAQNGLHISKSST
jgi:hypothetical protein